MTLDESDVLAGVSSNATKKFYLSTILAWLKSKISPSDIGAQSTITASGILKGDGAGGVTAATAGTDYGTYSKPSGGIPASDLASGVIPTVPSAYTSNPAMNGTASPGSSTDWARGDHVHPKDSSKADFLAFSRHTTDYSNPHQVTASQVGAADAESYPSGSITLLANNGYISSASLSACDRAGSIVAIAISINLAGSIPTTRCEFGTLHGVPKPRANTAGLFQITNYLFSIQIATNGKVYITSIGQAQGASTWAGTPLLTYFTDGTILS